MLLAYAALCGCGRSGEAERITQRADSWQATLRLVEAQLARGDVPGHYARGVAEGAARDLSAQRRKLAKAGIDATERRSLDARLQSLLLAGESLRRSAERVSRPEGPRAP